MGTFWFDLRDAVRGLTRDRGYAIIVILTLALAIGATSAVFSIVDGMLLKPLSYHEPDRLVALHERWHEFADRVPTLPVNERHFEHWRLHATSFAAMAQYLPLPANLTTGGEAQQISVARASSSLFDVLQVPAQIGRTLVAADEAQDAPDVAVISDGLWHRRFGGQPIVGRAITIDGRPLTVVGVLPPAFRLPMGEQLVTTVDAFVPLRVDVGWVGDHNNVAIARLREGVSVDQSRAELDALQTQVGARATEESGDTVTLSGVVTPLAESLVGRARRGVLLLFAAIVAVLLIACSNLANLSLTRTLGRARDGAIRTALGASRARVIRRIVLEQLMLSAAGAAVGLALARLALALFVWTAPVDLPRVDEIALDRRAVVFTALVALITSLVVSVLPAWHLAAQDVQGALRAGGTAVGGDRTGRRARSALLTLQVAVSVTLLAVTGLLGTSLIRVLAIDRGFSSHGVVTVPIALPAARYSSDRLRVDVYDRVLNDVRTIAGVQQVSPTSLLPLRGEGQVNFVVADGSNVPRAEQPSANFRFVAPEYFDTLAIRLSAGRTFTDTERDPARPSPAVVSESLARRLWPGERVIGKRFGRGIPDEPSYEVVGVAVDARTTSIEQTPPLMVYLPYWWRSRTTTSLLIRTSLAPTAVVPMVRRAVRNIDPEIAVGEARTVDSLVESATARRRYQARLFIAFGAAALCIAALGVYAVTAYSLSRRRREMNIRVALGARASEVLVLVLGQTGRAIGAGVILGIVGAVALGNSIASLLYEVHARDPLVLTSVVVGVCVVALTATLLATRRGLSLNPVDALRTE